MSFEFASSVTCTKLRNLHQCFFFFFFEGGESFNIGFLFFCNFKQKKIHQRWFPIFFQLKAKKEKKNPNVLGILIIWEHCFTLNFIYKCLKYFYS